MAEFLEGGISKISVEELLGTRCRLQRLKDLKFFAGWIQASMPRQVVVELKEKIPKNVGDRFNLEAATERGNIAFPCIVTRFEEETVWLEVSGEALITTPGQEPRFRASHISVHLSGLDKSLELVAEDISASGIGVLSQAVIPRFTRVKLTVRGSAATVGCYGIVRYCRPEQDNYRIGLQVEFEDRLSRAMWQRLVHAASQVTSQAA